jgi:hypothetical protein
MVKVGSPELQFLSLSEIHFNVTSGFSIDTGNSLISILDGDCAFNKKETQKIRAANTIFFIIMYI